MHHLLYCFVVARIQPLTTNKKLSVDDDGAFIELGIELLDERTGHISSAMREIARIRTFDHRAI